MFLALATSPTAVWRSNFRDLSASVMRMATLARGGRITADIVREEWKRLESVWQDLAEGKELSGKGPDAAAQDDAALLRDLLGERYNDLDLFDRPQLACVIRVCRSSRSLSEAGRQLFAESRQRKARPNDADRLRKYLAAFNLDWEAVR